MADQGQRRNHGLLAVVLAASLGLGARTLQQLGVALLTPLLRRLGFGQHVRAALTAQAEEDPVIAAHSFVTQFEALYGSHHPQFLLCSYRDALQVALREHKFLLVYLHSPKHQDTAAFCRDTLCHDAVVEFLAENVLVWGGDVRHSDAFQVSGMLRHATFPHIALLLVNSGTKASLAASFSGAKSAQTFMNVLAQAIENHGAALVAARVDAEERDYNRLIREQQDAEYEASLAADKARAEQAAAAREEEERIARQQAEREAAEKAALEAEQQAAAERAKALAARQTASAAALPSEPPPGPDAVQIMLRLPDGKRLQRRFDGNTSTTDDVYRWAEAEGVTAFQFRLVAPYPRTVYERGSDNLHAVGLGTQAALLIEELE